MFNKVNIKFCKLSGVHFEIRDCNLIEMDIIELNEIETESLKL